MTLGATAHFPPTKQSMNPSPRYLAGVVEIKPALQMDGIPAWHQTAILEDP